MKLETNLKNTYFMDCDMYLIVTEGFKSQLLVTLVINQLRTYKR